jgi:tRNA threonylcarbamoyladenosine biosynthesis protein TsaB
MITLALDASTYTGDVALFDESRLLAEQSTAMKGVHEERLMPAVEAVLASAGVPVSAVGRVVCGAGPGSFTSLRIAGAIAKGIATGVGCPLYAVPSMALVAGGASLAKGRYLVAIDALREEFYVGLYDVDAAGALEEIAPARLVLASEVGALGGRHLATIVSPSKTLDWVAVVSPPRARSAMRLEAMLAARGPVDLASWEPSYGRLAEAQVRWESAHGRPLPTS